MDFGMDFATIFAWFSNALLLDFNTFIRFDWNAAPHELYENFRMDRGSQGLDLLCETSKKLWKKGWKRPSLLNDFLTVFPSENVSKNRSKTHQKLMKKPLEKSMRSVMDFFIDFELRNPSKMAPKPFQKPEEKTDKKREAKNLSQHRTGSAFKQTIGTNFQRYPLDYLSRFMRLLKNGLLGFCGSSRIPRICWNTYGFTRASTIC